LLLPQQHTISVDKSFRAISHARHPYRTLHSISERTECTIPSDITESIRDMAALDIRTGYRGADRGDGNEKFFQIRIKA